MLLAGFHVLPVARKMTKRNRKKKQRSAKSSSSALTAAAESKAVYRPASVPEVKAQPAPESKADSNVEWLKKLPQPVLSMVFTYLPMLDHIALIRTCVACRVAGNKPSIWAVLDFSQLRFSGALARPFDDAVLSCAHLRPTRVVMVPRPGVGLPTHRSYPALKDMRTLTSLAIAVRPGHWDYLFPVLKGKPLQHLDIDLFPAQGGLQLAELPLTKLTLREAYRHYGDSTKECEQLATLKRLTRLQSLHVPWFNELILSAVEVKLSGLLHSIVLASPNVNVCRVMSVVHVWSQSLPLTALSIGQSTHPRNALVSYDHAAALAKLSSLRTLAYHGNDVGCPLFRHMLQLLPLTSLEITGRQVREASC